MKKVRELKKAETKFNRKQNFFQTKGIGSQTRTKNLVQVEASVLSEVCSGERFRKASIVPLRSLTDLVSGALQCVARRGYSNRENMPSGSL